MERKARQVYKPLSPSEEPPEDMIEDVACSEYGDEHSFNSEGLCDCGTLSPFHRPIIEEPIPVPTQPVEPPNPTLVERLIDLGIDPEALKQFCRVATIVPKPLPVDPWECYQTVYDCVQRVVEELKRCGAKAYHIRQALEAGIKAAERVEDTERRVTDEGASEEAEEAKNQQSGVAGSDDEAQKEETQEEA